MNRCIAEFPSYTYARKAERLLRSRGYRCELKRREKPRRSGCTWELHISAGGRSCRTALDVLDRYKLPYRLTDPDGESPMPPGRPEPPMPPDRPGPPGRPEPPGGGERPW